MAHEPASIADIPEADKAYLLGYMRHGAPDLYAEALASLQETHAALAARAAVTA